MIALVYSNVTLIGKTFCGFTGQIHFDLSKMTPNPGKNKIGQTFKALE